MKWSVKKLANRDDVFVDAISQLKEAEDKTGDADIGRRIARLEARMRALSSGADIEVGPTGSEFED